MLTESPNPYLEDGKSNLAVNIKILDVLYGNEVCSLVFMQDLSAFVQDSKKEQAQRSMLAASTYIQEDL